jgi:Kef-type K+ transport system membrane component KefB/Trk K+ transport system NAD-binding subunit
LTWTFLPAFIGPMQDGRSFAPLLVVVGLAFLVPLMLSRLKRLRLPIVVGEILAGILVGRSGFRLVEHEDPLLHLLAELGFVFLMFLSGMEVDFSTLWLSRRKADPKSSSHERWGPLSLGALNFLGTVVLSALAGWGLWKLELVHNAWMMALILSTTSLGVVVPVLKEHGLSSGRYGQTLLIAALIADFVTMLLITVLVAVLSGGAAMRILLIGVLFGAFFLLYRLGSFLNRVTVVRRTLEELSHATAQIKVRAAFALVLVFVALSEVIGAEVILGAFIAGAIIAMLRTERDIGLLHQLEGIGFGFFIPVFFIMVGVNFNLPSLLTSEGALWLLPLLLLAAVVVKLVPAIVFRLAYSWKESLAAGVMLSARLSLIIAAAAIGTRLEVISDSVNAAIILVAIITVTTAPAIFLRLVPGYHASKHRPIVVIGAGELGLQVAKQLKAHHDEVVVVDADRERALRAIQHEFPLVVATADEPHPELDYVLRRAETAVCTYNDTELSYRICRFLRATYGIENIVAHVAEPKELPRFQELGVTTLNPAMDRAAMLVLLARNPATFALLSRTDDDKEVLEVVMRNSAHVSHTLRDLRLPGDVLIVAMRREGELLVPHGNTRLEIGDRLTLVGSPDSIRTARGMLL